MFVVFYHYSGSTIPSIKPNPLHPVTRYGQHGVEMFFVISGFVIYLTLRRIGHAPSFADVRRFLLRRTVRVVAPAWASLALTFAVHYAAFRFHKPIDGGYLPLQAKTAACNVFLFCGFSGTPWMNGVYWTLEVELCFYVSFGLLYFLWRGDPVKTIVTYFAIGVAVWLLLGPAKPFFKYMLTFAAGAALADVLERGASRLWALPVAAASLGIVYLQAGLPAFLFSAAAVACIAALYGVRFSERALFLGKISFSLYLTHTLIAYFSEGVLKHAHVQSTAPGKIVMLFVYAAIAAVWGWIFFRVVEAPVVRRLRAIR